MTLRTPHPTHRTPHPVPRTILITGNAGFIGSSLTKKLLQLNYQVIGIDNFNDYYNPQIKAKNIAEFSGNKNFLQHRADIVNQAEIDLIFAKFRPDIVIHLAARAGVRPSLLNPKLYHQVNVTGTDNLLKLAKKYSVKQFIFASSSSIYGNQTKIPFSETDKLEPPVSPYAAGKQEAEKLCREWYQLTGINTTVLRFFTVYGPHGRPDMAPYLFTQKIIKGETITKYGNGSSSRDYTYIDDIISGIICAINQPFSYEIINLGNNQPVTLNKFIAVIEELTGKKAIIEEKPRHPADVPRTYADITKAKQLLNWQPTTQLEPGMKQFIRWYKNELLEK